MDSVVAPQRRHSRKSCKTPAMPDWISHEIRSLHAFFVDWFSGECTETTSAFEGQFARRLHPDFTIVQPAGELMTRSDLINGVRSSYGKSPGFRIAIRRVTVQLTAADIVVATYEEWQRNAVNSRPADNGRAATVVFANRQWRHVHETWLPANVMQAGPYDF